jgi:Domain of unknown function (DUF4402)
MRVLPVLSALTAVTLSLGVASANAQSSNINATATVLTAITITPTNLAFGNVTPGVNKTIAITDAGTGKWAVVKAAASSVSLAFTLPATLAGPAASTMPIGTWTGGYNNTADVPGSATTFTPSPTPTVVPTGGANLWVYVGATVSPGAAQTAGSYTGVVTMSIAYL